MNTAITEALNELDDIDKKEIPLWEHIYDMLNENKEIIKTATFFGGLAYLAYNIYTININQKNLEMKLEETIERVKEMDIDNESIKQIVSHKPKFNKPRNIQRPRKFLSPDIFTD